VFNQEKIANGDCKYSKYSRKRAERLLHTHHEFSNNYHYHYRCVLDSVSPETKQAIIDGKDSTAIKTHLPYYSGLNDLLVKTDVEQAEN
jgi:hypothetical protein